MDTKPHIIHHLYDDGDASGTLSELLTDEALRAEYEALAEVKAHLDERPPVRPDPAVIDRIVAAVASSPAGERAARERSPLRLVRRFNMLSGVAAAIAILLAVEVVWQQMAPREPGRALSSDAAEEMAPAPDLDAAPAPDHEALTTPSTGLLRPDSPAAAAPPGEASSSVAERREAVEQDAPAVARARAAEPETEEILAEDFVRAAQAEAEEGTDSIPAWDESGDLLRLHQRIEMLEARSRDLDWDEAAVMSLDQLPDENPDALRGLNATGSRGQPPGNP